MRPALRSAAVIILAVLAALPAVAAGPDVVLLDAVTTTGASASSLAASSAGPGDWVYVQTSGTYGAGTTVVIELTRNGTNWASAVASIAAGEVWKGPVCECLIRANVTVHEGGGKTVTVKGWVVGKGTAVAQ